MGRRVSGVTCSLLFKDAIKRLKLDIRNPCKDLDTPLGTGLRPSEALGLQWAALDTTARTLRVERAVTLHSQIKATKTGRVRVVPLTVPLVDALRGLASLRDAAAFAGAE